MSYLRSESVSDQMIHFQLSISDLSSFQADGPEPRMGVYAQTRAELAIVS